MTWTYSGDPSSSDRDEVRFLVGDTDSGSPLVTDEEIAYVLTDTSSPLQAAARVAESIAARYSRDADRRVGNLSLQSSQRAKAFLELASRLRRRASMALGASGWYAGGISKDDKETVEANTDRVTPAFTRDLFDTPGGIDGYDD